MARLACPQCGSEDLATTEDISGSAHGHAAVVRGERVFNHTGWTDVHWDSAESTGVECLSCFWRQEAAQDGPALDELVEVEVD
jgi:hypothetical protein